MATLERRRALIPMFAVVSCAVIPIAVFPVAIQVHIIRGAEMLMFREDSEMFGRFIQNGKSLLKSKSSFTRRIFAGREMHSKN